MQMITRVATTVGLLLVGALPALAQGTVAPVAKQTFTDANNNPVANGRLYVYAAGTTTPVTIYTDATLLVPALNAAVCGCSNLDASGRFTIFLSPSTYRFTLKTSSDVLVWDVDGVPSVPTFAGNVDIQGTAGEALTAGQCVYLSDGSGSKTAARWYKCDSANTYSSTTPEVGFVPVSIATGLTGTVRIGGTVTSLSGLSAGTRYYIGTAGAVTATAPANGRAIGSADSATSLVLSLPRATPVVEFTCTAGETIAAGLAVYVSDGSGAKTQGQCYKGDSANGYSSSTATVVGLAPATITSGSTGTVRIAGAVTGLSALTAGAPYYIGTAGALTATAPLNARTLGAADTTTSLVLTLPTVTPNADNGIDDFRLSLSSGVPVPSTDVTAATTLYCTPAGKGNRMALYSSAGVATVYTSAEFSIAVPATTSTTYDIFAFASGTTPTLELLAWRNSGQAITGATNATPIVITANAHGLSNGDEVYVSGVKGNTAANATWTVANVTANTFELATSVGNGAYTAATGYLNARASTGKLVLTTTGTYTKTADLTRRYLATFRTTTVSGQTEDSQTKRYLWNYYNRAPRSLLRLETTVSWNYTLATIQQANASPSNQVDVVVGVAEVPIDLVVTAVAANAATDGTKMLMQVGIGEDSTTTFATGLTGGALSSALTTGAVSSYASGTARLFKAPSAGRHVYSWNEWSQANGATAWYGAPAGPGGPTGSANGLTGSIQGD